MELNVISPRLWGTDISDAVFFSQNSAKMNTVIRTDLQLMSNLELASTSQYLKYSKDTLATDIS